LAAADPKAALALLELVAPFAPDAKAELKTRRTLLERLHQTSPKDPDVASGLAEVYDAAGEPDKCEAVLGPVAGNLGSRNGAGILGRIKAGRGRRGRLETAGTVRRGPAAPNDRDR